MTEKGNKSSSSIVRNSKLGKKMCTFCQENIFTNNIVHHERICKSYFKFWKRTSNDLMQCLLCLKEYKLDKQSDISNFYVHLRKKHFTLEGLNCKFCPTKCSDKLELLHHVNLIHKNEKHESKLLKNEKTMTSEADFLGMSNF